MEYTERQLRSMIGKSNGGFNRKGQRVYSDPMTPTELPKKKRTDQSPQVIYVERSRPDPMPMPDIGQADFWSKVDEIKAGTVITRNSDAETFRPDFDTETVKPRKIFPYEDRT